MPRSSEPNRHTHRIQFRASLGDLERIQQGAHGAGRNLSEFIRLSALGEAQTAWRGDPFLRRAYLSSATLQASVLRLAEATVSFRTEDSMAIETRDAIIRICTSAGATAELLLGSIREHERYLARLRRGRK